MATNSFNFGVKTKGENNHYSCHIAEDGTLIITPVNKDVLKDERLTQIQTRVIKDKTPCVGHILILAPKTGFTDEAILGIKTRVLNTAQALGATCIQSTDEEKSAAGLAFAFANDKQSQNLEAEINAALDKFCAQFPARTPDPAQQNPPKQNPPKQPDPPKQNPPKQSTPAQQPQNDFWAPLPAYAPPERKIGQDGLLDTSGYYAVPDLKPDPPKQNPPKQNPPKQPDPPKQNPPKQPDPPKQNPPKQNPNSNPAQ